ncbi:MAG: ABC transporter substrate-binding protein [Pseudomonadota bacterium]
MKPLHVLVAAGLALCGAAQAAGTLTFCIEGAPEGFDIAQYETIVTNDAAGLTLYDTLLQMKPGTTQVEPALAERWEVSADGKVYTLHLRKGVQFHTTPWFKPTRELNADDVVWSLSRINDKQHPAHAAARNGFPYWAGMSMPALVKSVRKAGPMSVRIELTRPEAAFPANLTMTSIASVYSAEYGEQLARAGKLEQLNTQPVGTGPFMLKSYQKDAVIRYSAHKPWWGGAPKVDHLVFAVTVDNAVLVQRLKAGECMVGRLANDKAAAFANDPKFTLVRSKPLTTTYVAPNAQRPFTGDKRLRQALSLAIDRAAIVQSVYGGEAEIAGSFLPPGIWSHDPQLKEARDLDKARQLVKASGYDGRELQLFATAGKSDVKRFVELLQADWARIGVKVAVRLMELGELYKRTGQGEHDLALLSWYSDNGDPDNFFTPNLACAAVEGGGNKARWCDPRFDALLSRARATTDFKQRTEAYAQAQRLLHDEAGVLPLAHRYGLVAVDKRVTGFVATPFGGHDFRAAGVK